MKLRNSLIATLTIAWLTGCDANETVIITPAAADLSDQRKASPTEKAITILVPSQPLIVEPEATVEGTIGIKRGRNFNHDVMISFRDLPAEVSPMPATVEIPQGVRETNVQFRTTGRVVPGDYQILVVAHPPTGEDVTKQLAITIISNDSFSLTVPKQAVTFKQNESTDVTIGVIRNKTFHQDVTIYIEDLPIGLTVKPTTRVVSKDSREAKFTFSAAEDAAVGDFEVKVIGNPKSGRDITKGMKVHISKK